MQSFLYRCDILVMIVVFLVGYYLVEGSVITPSTASVTSFVLPKTTSSPVSTCEFRTINYITHNLPQVCLRYAWSDSARLDSPHATATDEKTSASSGTDASPEESDMSLEDLTIVDSDADGALDDSSFLSFEDWRRQTLEKEGLPELNTGERRVQVAKDGERRRNPDGIRDALKALEEDVVIDTHFTAFLAEHSGTAATKTSQSDHAPTQSAVWDALKAKDADESRRLRSKDAGKTCKERFNFASLDAGGQVMKTNREARSASALLKEDRDVYMLNSCQAKNKFLIVELSESILVETVAIANFEFFSSTFRQFRIGVSDRYPVKLDRWVDLGTFEARNSRDIQAFLVEDPRIWARYLRIEFLSHYGKEFYCPVSLLRVHGRTMIQDVLGMEEPTRSEDDIEDSLEDLNEQNSENSMPQAAVDVLEDENRVTEGLREAEAALEELVRTAEAITFPQRIAPLNSSQIIDAKRWLENVSLEQTTTIWVKGESLLTTLFEHSQLAGVCFPSDGPSRAGVESQKRGNESNVTGGVYQSQRTVASLNEPSTISVPPRRLGLDTNGMTAIEQFTSSIVSSLSHDPATVTLISKESATSQPISGLNIYANGTATSSVKSVNKTSPTATLYSPQPTTQESFFKTVTKRLQLLETNSTLSLKYIEEQSKILRDAFTKVEKRQLGKTTSFLENLNGTVLDELRKFGQQYEEIWQSTVIELETQRDQAQREIAAVSTRLSILADELVFQKRMSIVQSILLLLCLGLVIFSRNPIAGYNDLPAIQNMVTKARNLSDFSLDSSPSGPPTNRMAPSLRDRHWPGAEHRRQRSDDSAGSLRSTDRDYSPATPVSANSQQRESHKPINEGKDLLKSVRPSSVTNPLMMQSGHPEIADPRLLKWQDSDNISEEESFPDFGNSALWLAPGATVLDTNKLVHYGEAYSGGKGQSPNHGTYECKPDRTMNTYFDEGVTRSPTQSPPLPSATLELERPEFSIARKPLPALPRDDQ